MVLQLGIGLQIEIININSISTKVIYIQNWMFDTCMLEDSTIFHSKGSFPQVQFKN